MCDVLVDGADQLRHAGKDAPTQSLYLSRPSSIMWEQLSGQFAHSYTLLRKFRAYFAESLKRVHVVYPEAKLYLTGAGNTLLPSRAHVPRDALT